MPRRTVSVGLEMDVARYVQPAGQAERATKGINDALGETVVQGERASRSLDDVGDEMGDAQRAASSLDREIDQLKTSLRELAIQSALTGDVDVAGKMEEQQRRLSETVRKRKLIGDEDSKRMGFEMGANIGVSSARGFFANFSTSLRGAAAGNMGIAAAPVIAALVPTIGAGIAGAVVGGIGLGGMVGGMMLAAKNAQVKSAAFELGSIMMGDLEKRADKFVAPMLQGLFTVRAAWQDMGGDMDRIFNSSRFVTPMTNGIVQGMRSIVRGAADAIDAADPVISQFGNSISRIGSAVGNTFSTLSQDADEGASAIDDLTIAIESSIETVTVLIHTLAQVKGGFDAFDRVIDSGRHNIEKNVGAMLGMKDGIDLTADGFKAGSVEAEAYNRKVTGTATAADLLVLEQAALKKSTDGVTATTVKSANAMDDYEASEAMVKDRSDELKKAQQALKDTIGMVSAEQAVAKTRSDALKNAMEGLYGATIRNEDANQSYEASWDSLSDSVKKNKNTLDIHSQAGRANRDSIKAVIKSTNDLYLAEIETGVSVDSATKKHGKRIEALKEEARRLGLDRAETNRLIQTYGRIPPKKTTDIILSKVDNVADALLDLAAIQLHLAKGTPLGADLRRRLSRAQYGMPDTKRAYGGPLPGSAPHDRADNMVYSGTPGEWVIQRPTVRKVERDFGQGAMAYFNRYGELPAFASGGLLRASHASWGGDDALYRVTAGMTRVMSLADAISKVPAGMVGNPGNWPSSPSAQRGDSGVWRGIVRMIRATGPMSGAFGNSYRPGDPKWHGSGRAVDWMGYNQDALASYLAARRPLELIHRTRHRDYAYTRGRNKGSFNNALMQAHRNHIHIAMKNGGMIREPVVGFGMSGRTYSFGEAGPEKVMPASGGGGGGNVITNVTIPINLPIGVNPRDAGRQIADVLETYFRGGGRIAIRGSVTA